MKTKIERLKTGVFIKISQLTAAETLYEIKKYFSQFYMAAPFFQFSQYDIFDITLKHRTLG
ncbi:hypothetical protein DN068_15395 [Taibaiella soli]|uniref:Uncharacterized protein n=1 Tax=Taibaiella soli TaxID=1649169 RepID=A0A2W2AWE8_9BACT|nr:hypothetical protein DN068_15395 [Taibaiella soli]